MKRYNPKEIEPRWQQEWDETGVYTADLASDKPKYIAMSMFNYPSGAGIHIGHAMNYTISDVKARFKRQQGYESYHPVGWDAFGLPAENYAIKAGVSPQQSMATIIPSYHKQYKAMGWSNDWEKEIATHLPEYYKWTQWIFWKMHEQGLAYQDSRMQWWCTKCQTVLANEQVIDGKCWRHDGADDPNVEKKEVKQWFFKITEYADELLEAIDGLDWTETVKLAQRNWIGKSVGAEVRFDVAMPAETNFVILHGHTGSPEKNFIPNLKKQLESKGFKVQAPLMPNPETPTEAEQVAYVLEHCTFDEHTVLVGHSLGGVVAMKVLQQLETNIDSLVLVAPAIADGYRNEWYTKKNAAFLDKFDMTYDYDVLQAKTKRRFVLSDLTEAELRKEYLLHLAKELGAEYLESTATKRHFTAEDEPFIAELLLPNLTVFTTAHDTIYGATFMVLAPEHELVDRITTAQQRSEIEAYRTEALKKSEVQRQQEGRDKTGVFTGAYAVNPLSGRQLPIWVADYVLSGYGTGAIMAVPGEDERDYEFAQKFGLDIVYTTKQQEFVQYADIKAAPQKYIVANSEEFDGMTFAEARPKILAKLEASGAGTAKTNYRMRDWSVSRQRYWGAPIPIVNCAKDGAVLVPEKDLPIVLPELDDFKPSGDGHSALARASDWLETTCPQCGGPAERETDTLDTYICSSWYMYRYFDPHNQHAIFDSTVVKKWEPIDFYNGADHATAHLLYARFIGHFFTRLGLVDEPEPFKQFLFNGKVTAQDGTMFSKSKGNGVDPLEIIEQGYGADALRTYLMFAAPLDVWIRWDPQGVPGTHRFLSRIWTLVQEYLEAEKAQASENAARDIRRTTHTMIRKMTEDIEENRYNTAIAAAMTAVNDLYKYKVDSLAQNDVWQEALEAVVACVAPFAPHIAEELWFQLGHHTSIHRDSWPKWNEAYFAQDAMTIVVQVNGKLRGSLQVAADASEEAIVAAAKADSKVTAHLDGHDIVKTIYVPKKLVSFVVK